MAARKKSGTAGVTFKPLNDSRLVKAQEREREYHKKVVAERKRLDEEATECIAAIPAAIGGLVLETLYGGDWHLVDLASLSAALRAAEVAKLPADPDADNIALYRRLCESATAKAARSRETPADSVAADLDETSEGSAEAAKVEDAARPDPSFQPMSNGPLGPVPEF